MKTKAENEYCSFPKAILQSIKKFESAFLHKYPNLDVVLQGGDLIERPKFIKAQNNGLLTFHVSPKCKAKVGDHVFLGAIKVKGVALAYVHSFQCELITIGCMSSHIQE